MVVSIADPVTGETFGSNAIFGDAIVVDTLGQAYSFGAISFQAEQGANNGDKAYEFSETREYSEFPSVLAANFLAPGVLTAVNNVSAELILFTLDYQTDPTELPVVNIGGKTYNSDEQYCNWGYNFECFEIVALEDISLCNQIYPPGDPRGLGSISGHLQMFPDITATAGTDPHDAPITGYGDGDNIRNRGFHGWIVQNALAGAGGVLPGGEPIVGTPAVAVANQAAWGRPLAQSETGLDVSGTDILTLDAEKEN
jgi:hypothetical protein